MPNKSWTERLIKAQTKSVSHLNYLSNYTEVEETRKYFAPEGSFQMKCFASELHFPIALKVKERR